MATREDLGLLVPAEKVCPEHPGQEKLYCNKCVNAIGDAAHDLGYFEALKWMRENFGGMDWFDERDRDKVIARLMEEMGIRED